MAEDTLPAPAPSNNARKKKRTRARAQTVPVRFQKYVNKTAGGCWEWTGGVQPNGYGVFSGSGYSTRYAHRISYLMYVGPIPGGLQIDHLCRNRKCVNPAHLEAVTRQVNVIRGDGWAGGNARKTHCVRGHPFTPDNTQPGYRGTGRQCKACRRLYDSAAYKADRAAAALATHAGGTAHYNGRACKTLAELDAVTP